MKILICHHCQHEWGFEPPISRNESCPKCLKDAKVCLNCRFYERAAHNECRETEAEYVRDKEAGNYCSYFSPREGVLQKSEEKSQIQLELDKLFKK
jgi:hypothetical protein